MSKLCDDPFFTARVDLLDATEKLKLASVELREGTELTAVAHMRWAMEHLALAFEETTRVLIRRSRRDPS